MAKVKVRFFYSDELIDKLIQGGEKNFKVVQKLLKKRAKLDEKEQKKRMKFA